MIENGLESAPSSSEPVKLRSEIVFLLLRFLSLAGKVITENEAKEVVSSLPSSDDVDVIEGALNYFGFMVTVGKSSISDLNSVHLPAFVAGNDGEVAILVAIKKNKFSLLKGNSKKIVSLDDKQFREWFDGFIVEAVPEDEGYNSVKRRLAALSPFKSLGSVGFFWVAITTFMSNILGLATSIFVMVVYDRVLPNQAQDSLYALAFGVGLAILFDTLLKNAKNNIVEKSAIGSDIPLTNNIFDQFVNVSDTKKTKGAGEMSSIIRDFEQYRDFMSTATILAFVDLPFILVFVVVIYLIAGPLFLVPLICIPTIILAILVVQPLLKKNTKQVTSATQSRQGVLVEMLTGIDAVKANGAFGLMKRRFLSQSSFYSAASNKAKGLSNISTNIITVVQQGAQVATIVFGFHLFVNQVITMGTIIAAVILSGRALQPLAKIAQTLSRANTALVARKNLIDFLKGPRLADYEPTGIVNRDVDVAVSLNNVTVRLSETGPALFDQLHLKINSGEKIAIVGKSGSGKTTLLRSVLGLNPLETGNIAIFGRDIRNYKRPEMHLKIGTVFQEPWLFAGSLRENVALGSEEISDDDILESLKVAGANFIGVDDYSSLDLPVNDRGGNLSGGQKQSIVLARALVFKPDLFVLDEPTSAMDGEGEDLTIRNLLSTHKEKTFIFVTHKIRVLSACDRVLVIDQGRVALDCSRDDYFLKVKAQNKNA